MDDEIEKIKKGKQITSRLENAIGNLNLVLAEASDLGMYIIIHTEEENVSSKNNRTKIVLRKASYSVEFSNNINKFGGSEGMGHIHSSDI